MPTKLANEKPLQADANPFNHQMRSEKLPRTARTATPLKNGGTVKRDGEDRVESFPDRFAGANAERKK